jgi:hypothetical protein
MTFIIVAVCKPNDSKLVLNHSKLKSTLYYQDNGIVFITGTEIMVLYALGSAGAQFSMMNSDRVTIWFLNRAS